MTPLLTAAAGLGLAGIDPAGAALAIAALARGASRRSVVSFALAIVFGTALLGTLLALTLGHELTGVDWSGLLPTGDLAAVIELSLAAALFAWAAIRVTRPQARPRRPHRRRGVGEAAMVGMGLLFAASAVLDPTFVGLVLISGRDEPLLEVAIAQLIWVLISQAPLVVLAIATSLGAHENLLNRFGAWWTRVGPKARFALTSFLFLAATVLAADALTQLLTGQFLIAPEASASGPGRSLRPGSFEPEGSVAQVAP
jgi:hypothetical protein